MMFSLCSLQIFVVEGGELGRRITVHGFGVELPSLALWRLCLHSPFLLVVVMTKGVDWGKLGR
jgi:hypothetical protein